MPLNPFARKVDKPRGPAVLGFIEAEPIKSTSERFSVYGHKYVDLTKKTEKELMASYREQYLSNPLAALCIDYMTARLGSFNLAGASEADVERATKILDDMNFWYNFYETVHQMVLNGTGIMVKNPTFGGRFRRTDTSQWTITRDNTTGVTYYSVLGLSEGTKVNKYEWPPGEMVHKDIAVFKVLELPDRPEGISFMRTSLNGLASLQELIFMDIPAGVHNFLTVERILQTPLDGYDTEAKQITFMAALRDHWKNRDPSSIGITVMDSKVKIGYMGVLEGSGGSQSRVLAINDFIAPILSIVMLNFLMPLGLLLQTGANKAIIKRQQLEANLRMSILRRRLEEQVYVQSWPDFGLDPTKVWIEWPKTDTELMDEWVLNREMLDRQIISKEYIRTRYDIKDNGKDFYEGPPQASSTKADADTGSNVDGG